MQGDIDGTSAAWHRIFSPNKFSKNHTQDGEIHSVLDACPLAQANLTFLLNYHLFFKRIG